MNIPPIPYHPPRFHNSCSPLTFPNPSRPFNSLPIVPAQRFLRSITQALPPFPVPRLLFHLTIPLRPKIFFAAKARDKLREQVSRAVDVVEGDHFDGGVHVA